MKAFSWSTNDGNASWTVNGSQRPRQGTKPASGKIANCSSYYYSFKSYSRKKIYFMIASTPTLCTLLHSAYSRFTFVYAPPFHKSWIHP